MRTFKLPSRVSKQTELNQFSKRIFLNKESFSRSKSFQTRFFEVSKLFSVCNYFLQGNHHVVNKNYDDALKCFSHVLELSPLDGNAYYNRGLVYFILGDHERASMDFSAALQCKASLEGNVLKMGHRYMQLKEWEAAKICFEAIHSGHKEVVLPLAIIYHKKKQYVKALTFYEQYFEDDHDNENVKIRYYQAQAYFQSGDLKAALTTIDLCLDKNTDILNVYYLKAGILKSLGCDLESHVYYQIFMKMSILGNAETILDLTSNEFNMDSLAYDKGVNEHHHSM